MPVIVEKYNPEWANQFKQIKAELESFLQDVAVVSIEHVGSTSVPGLAAKPIIDIDIVVERPNVQPAIDALVAKEFIYLGELGIIDRHALRSPNSIPPRNVYITVKGCFSLRNHLGVRNTLRNDEALRDEYGQVKLDLAAQGLEITEYVDAKSDIITKILKKSGLLTEEELEAINAANQNASRINGVRTARLLLREYIMDDVPAYQALESNPDVIRYQNFAPRTLAEAREKIAECLRASVQVPREIYEIAVLHESKFIGRVGARVQRTYADGSPRNPPYVSLWFSFLPEVQGKGFATEAMEAFIPLLGSPLEMEIECDPRNRGSWRLAERLGFERIKFTELAYESKGEMVGSVVYRKVVD